MTNEIVEHQPNRLSPAMMRDQVNHIQRIMKEVMKPGLHYGIIPGCDKPSLYQPGAEKIALSLNIGLLHEVENLSDGDHHKFRTKSTAINRNTGEVLGDYQGSASTAEDKYAWRKAVCDEEWDGTDETRRRIKYGHQRGSGYYTVKQVRTNPADLENTVLKMSEKRADVGCVKCVTAASDVFGQDIEDLLEGLDQGEGPRPPIQQPQARTEPPPTPPFLQGTEPKQKVQSGQGSPPVASSENTEVGIASSVEEKTGNKNGKDWTRYDIYLAGEKHATFSETFAALADDSIEHQSPISIEFKTGKWGRDVVNVVAVVG